MINDIAGNIEQDFISRSAFLAAPGTGTRVGGGGGGGGEFVTERLAKTARAQRLVRPRPTIAGSSRARTVSCGYALRLSGDRDPGHTQCGRSRIMIDLSSATSRFWPLSLGFVSLPPPPLTVARCVRAGSTTGLMDAGRKCSSYDGDYNNYHCYYNYCFRAASCPSVAATFFWRAGGHALRAQWSSVVPRPGRRSRVDAENTERRTKPNPNVFRPVHRYGLCTYTAIPGSGARGRFRAEVRPVGRPGAIAARAEQRRALGRLPSRSTMQTLAIPLWIIVVGPRERVASPLVQARTGMFALYPVDRRFNTSDV